MLLDNCIAIGYTIKIMGETEFNKGKRDFIVKGVKIGVCLFVLPGLAELLAACTISPTTPQEIAGQITSHKDGSAVKTTEELSGIMSGTRSPGDSFWVVEREIGDPLLRMHPQGQGKNGDEPAHEIDAGHWAASAIFGFAGNTDRDVPFGVLFVYATSSATMAYQGYLRDSKAKGEFPGITKLYPDSHIVAQVSVHRPPLS